MLRVGLGLLHFNLTEPYSKDGLPLRTRDRNIISLLIKVTLVEQKVYKVTNFTGLSLLLHFSPELIRGNQGCLFQRHTFSRLTIKVCHIFFVWVCFFQKLFLNKCFDILKIFEKSIKKWMKWL